ncbi:MAG: hypothetical protein RR048_05465 [Oscillospiraceae bacterium]
MLNKVMSTVLSLAMAISFSVCAFAEGEPSNDASASAPIEEEQKGASPIAIWGGTGAFVLIVAGLMFWKRDKDDFN